MRRGGRTLIEDISEFDELARLLWFAGKIGMSNRRTIPVYELRALCMQYAGVSARFPNPEAGLHLLSALELASVRDTYVTFNDRGSELTTLSSSPSELNRDQREVLLGHLAMNPAWRKRLLKVVRMFRKDSEGNLATFDMRRSRDATSEVCLVLLQHLGVVEGIDGGLVLRIETLQPTDLVITPHLAISPKEYASLLEKRQQVGEAAERYAVEWEKARLKAIGSASLEPYVVRVSEQDIGLGYDILSVEGGEQGDEERFIEVKGTGSNSVAFHLSQNELETGRTLGNRYWLYFIPRASGLPDVRPSPYLFQNPFREPVELFRMLPEEFLVSLIGRGVLFRKHVTAIPGSDGWMIPAEGKPRTG